MNTRILPAVIGLLSLLITPSLTAQETTIAVGSVNSAGDLLGSSSSPGGTLSSSRPATGEYHLTLDAPGAFVGAGIGDFMVHAMVRSAAASDRNAVTEIASVSDDSLTIVVYVSDVEDSGNLSLAEAANASFQFVIRRFPSASAIPAASRYLYATGVVSAGGLLLGGTTVDGAEISSARAATGDYVITITNPSGYSGQSLSDYLVIATPRSSSIFQDNLAVGIAESFFGNSLFITVNLSDVQNATDISPEADDANFQFAVYRTLASAASGPAESNLLVGAASVDGSNGLLRRGSVSLPGGFVTSERSGDGTYRVVLHAPGGFAGRGVNDYSVEAGINATSHSDEIIGAVPLVIDPDSLTIEVRTNDVEQNGSGIGTGVNSDFFLTVHDVDATSRPDLRIGKKPSLSSMKGKGIYNSNARGQKINIAPSSDGRFKIHLSTENDGNITGNLITRGKRAPGLAKTRVFRLSGGKKNVTAAFRTSGDPVAGVRPGEIVRHEVRALLRPDSSKSRAKLRFTAAPGAGDSALARVTRKR